MNDTFLPSHFGVAQPQPVRTDAPKRGDVAATAAAVAVTIPHALGLGLIVFSPYAHLASASALTLWSAALPGLLMALLVRKSAVIYAPNTAVSLLFAGMLALVMQTGAPQAITLAQALAITGAFVALGFGLQWLIGIAGLAGLSRFLPVGVTRGFAAGVGLALIATQFRSAFGAGAWTWDERLLWHAVVAMTVLTLSMQVHRRWPRLPSLIIASVLVATAAHLALPENTLVPSVSQHPFVLPFLPDWLGAPWWVVLHQAGGQLLSLALLMGLVNGLEVLVYHQELETNHMRLFEPGRVLTRESPVSALCALLGMIPSSTSASRSRIALQHTGTLSRRVSYWHAGAMVLVAVTGHFWLHLLPYACLAGALLFAGWRMIPLDMLNRTVSANQRGALWQSWLVACFFAFVGGVSALLVGLAVSTLELLRASSTHAIRRIHLEGKLRSRHVRRTVVDAWLSKRMFQVAVFELQGIVSFGVVAQVVEQVRKHLGEHRCVILDAGRVPAWDDTGFERLRGLARELKTQGVALVVCGVRGGDARALGELPYFEYLDLALEWAENQILRDCPPEVLNANRSDTLLGDLGEALPPAPRLALEARLKQGRYAGGELLFRSGESGRSLMLVQQGLVVLSTTAVVDQGLRLAVIGPGMVFGEMAFLSGSPRTAFAVAGQDGALVYALDWSDYHAWAQQEPEAALIFMGQLARMEIRRLGSTTQELRAAME